MQRYTLLKARFDAQIAELSAFRLALFKALGPTVRLFLSGPLNNVALHSFTLDQIMGQLNDKYGSVRHSDGPTVHDTIADYLKLHVDAHTTLAQHNWPVSEYDKVEYLKAGLGPCGKSSQTIVTFHQQYPQVDISSTSHFGTQMIPLALISHLLRLLQTLPYSLMVY